MLNKVVTLADTPGSNNNILGNSNLCGFILCKNYFFIFADETDYCRQVLLLTADNNQVLRITFRFDHFGKSS